MGICILQGAAPPPHAADMPKDATMNEYRLPHLMIGAQHDADRICDAMQNRVAKLYVNVQGSTASGSSHPFTKVLSASTSPSGPVLVAQGHPQVVHHPPGRLDCDQFCLHGLLVLGHVDARHFSVNR